MRFWFFSSISWFRTEGRRVAGYSIWRIIIISYPIITARFRALLILDKLFSKTVIDDSFKVK